MNTSNYMGRGLMIGLLLCLAGSLQAAPAAKSEQVSPPVLPAGVTKPAFFDKEGITVLSYQKGVSGLNIWQVIKGTTKTVFYTSADNRTLMSGVLWDAATGANISDAYIPEAAQVAEAAPQKAGFSHDKVSDAIRGVSQLGGIKEGNAPSDKTIYIIFDPRCHYCHDAYKQTRQFVKSGGSIKWIPTTVLGDSRNGITLIADILQSKNPVATLADTMGKRGAGSSTPSAKTLQTVSENEDYFFAAFDRNKSVGPAGVPVAFFETQDGAPQMVVNASDATLLNRIMKDVKK